MDPSISVAVITRLPIIRQALIMLEWRAAVQGDLHPMSPRPIMMPLQAVAISDIVHAGTVSILAISSISLPPLASRNVRTSDVLQCETKEHATNPPRCGPRRQILFVLFAQVVSFRTLLWKFMLFLSDNSPPTSVLQRTSLLDFDDLKDQQAVADKIGRRATDPQSPS